MYGMSFDSSVRGADCTTPIYVVLLVDVYAPCVLGSSTFSRDNIFCFGSSMSASYQWMNG